MIMEKLIRYQFFKHCNNLLKFRILPVFPDRDHFCCLFITYFFAISCVFQKGCKGITWIQDINIGVCYHQIYWRSWKSLQFQLTEKKAFKILKLPWHMFSKLQIETQNLLSSKKYKVFLFAFCYHGTKTFVSQQCVLEKIRTVFSLMKFQNFQKVHPKSLYTLPCPPKTLMTPFHTKNGFQK